MKRCSRGVGEDASDRSSSRSACAYPRASSADSMAWRPMPAWGERFTNARTATHDYAKSIETLKEIRQLAPEWLRNHRIAHDVVIRLLGKVSSRRAKSSGLADLATFMEVTP